MNRLVVVLFTMLTVSVFGQTTLTGNLMHDGINRNYRLRLPANHDKNIPIPLVFNLHGFTSNASQQELYSAMNAVADTARFAVCYPNGVGNAWNVGWNFGSTADDVGFISAMIDKFHLDYGIDRSKVYACGMSNGGFMSYRLACELNDRIAAIASVTGSMVQQALDICKPNKSVPVMEIHGTADATVNYNGTPNVSVAIPLLLRFWQENNGCDVNPTIEQVPDINPNDNTTTEKWTYTNCTDDKKLVHFKVINGAHTWPGAPITLGATSQDFKASVEIWNFFKQYSLENTTSSAKDIDIQVSIHPNPACDMVQISSDRPGVISVISASGSIVKDNIEFDQNTIVQIGDLPVGLYYIMLKTANRTQTTKFIKI